MADASLSITERLDKWLWCARFFKTRALASAFCETAGVRIADHHTVAQAHVRFEEDERAAGRPVTGRWDWLVPPISGAATAVWTRSYDPTEYSPNFRYQPAHC